MERPPSYLPRGPLVCGLGMALWALLVFQSFARCSIVHVCENTSESLRCVTCRVRDSVKCSTKGRIY